MFERLKILTRNIAIKQVNLINLLKESMTDFIRFIKYSATFKLFSKSHGVLEGRLTAHYHAIEKGLSMQNFRPFFGKRHVEAIDYYLRHIASFEKSERDHSTHVVSALSCLKNYLDKHSSLENNYLKYVEKVLKTNSELFEIDVDSLHCSTISHSFKMENDIKLKGEVFDFKELANSRKSIRRFESKPIPENTLREVVELSLTAPSVCNRQSTKLLYITEEKIISQILDIQGGANSFRDEVSNLIMVFSNLQVFEGVQERHQPYIDSGIFSMNLIYSLEYNGINSCPLMWPNTKSNNKKLYDLLNIEAFYEPIMALAIGYRSNQAIDTPKSKRISVGECMEFRK